MADLITKEVNTSNGNNDLLPCPFCGGVVNFHASKLEQDFCDGCHYIACSGPCGGFFDFSTVVDPDNSSETIEALRERIVPVWNKRSSHETLPCALPPPVALSETDVAIAQTAATARAEMCGICDEEFIGHRHGARGHDWMPKSPPPAQKAEVCGRCRGSGRVPSPGGVEGEYCACGRCGGSGHAKSEGDQR